MNLSTRAFAILLSAFAVAGGLSGLRAQQANGGADAVTGIWLNAEQDAKIEVFKRENSYYGKIIWMKEPDENGSPRLDQKNPEEKLKSRPLMNLVIMQDFSFDGEDEWTGGRIYDPKSGKEYTGKISLENSDTMMLRGYVLVPLFGRSEKWTRVLQEGAK